ncbi:thiol:disulfide interchange protein DsbG [Escherichia marmotae]|uniref:Thiol:disulfide interchange protein n=1 Tax=Escherichia marmotae TaxID=1499973 RepID=A0A7L6L6G8_9ESCH|nr:thiol:disulfide interchange protein DsbG [Escherichia marmotae]MEC9607069.1 thiol:disulfide interchange protein DsbG [Escherichia marmotae]MED0232125.1 thiol:disulfide interchange protein DsbG [Escherichia marmotae]MED0541453.1 thiol:disulfide interchange protein DsbG [Escherichia marmotae]MED8764356.1 thiol:disulfide interchange protein DsbG [Escherichia marmotae]MED8804761.1 thiol:disulfide interchange protein DsbG [Escherichia marmotae]
MLKKIIFFTLLPGIAYAEELPAPVKAIEKQGITIIKSFDAPGGMKGYLGKYQDMGVTIYLTPDGKHAISGYMYNEKGENLSNALIEKEIYAPAGREMWQRMEQSNWLLDGKKDAPVVVYVFADPFCPYCKQFWQQARPWVDAGKVQIRTLLVGVIKPESPTTAAAILASKDPAKTWQEYEASGGKLKLNLSGSITPEQMKILSANETLMDELGANVTPAIYYMSPENTLQQAVGLPDQKTFNIIMGNK